MRVKRTGPPTHALAQRERVLGILRAAGALGVRRDTFIYAHGITQPGARVAELIEEGFHISSRKAHPEDRFKTYFLESEPTIRKAVTRYTPKQKRLTDDGGDWYERVTGQKRATGLPLFDLNAEASR